MSPNISPPVPTATISDPDPSIPPAKSVGQIKKEISQLVRQLSDSCPNCEREKENARMWESMWRLVDKERDEMRVRLSNATIKCHLEAVELQKQEAYAMIAQQLNLGLPVGYVVTAETILEKLRKAIR